MQSGRRLKVPAYLVSWGLIALPGLVMLAYDAATDHRGHYVMISGIMASCFLILSLCVTPLIRLLPAGGYIRIIRRNRRYLGVAAFLYTALHLAYYLKNGPTLKAFLRTFVRPEIVTGWIAFAIFAVLAATSTDAAVRRLGPSWKRLHFWVYAAGVLTFLHWATSGGGWVEPLLYTAPLILLRIAVAVR